MIPDLYFHVAALVVVTVGAGYDWRTGHIPNWITLPPLVIAPILHGISGGLVEFGYSAVGIFVCGLGPWTLYKLQNKGGGDVKLFAALGALLGAMLGLQAEFLSLIVATLYSLGALAWNGKLWRTLANSLFLMLNPILPEKWKRSIPDELKSMVRLGISAFVGTVVAIGMQYPVLWMGLR